MHTEYISDLFWFFIKSNVYYFSKNYSVLLKALSFLSENEGQVFKWTAQFDITDVEAVWLPQ